MLLAMIIVDLEHYFIPDVMQYVLTIFVGLLVVFNDNFSLISALGNGAVYVLFGAGLFAKLSLSLRQQVVEIH
jgi:hypothetical protein